MSKRELAIAFILIVGLLAPLINIPGAKGITLFPQDQTISIVDTHDDRWITELGRHFDSPLVQILDPDQDLVSYLIFRNVTINFWEPLSPGNATLRLRTTSNQSFDDSSVTIYGMKVDELQTISVGAPFVLSVPYTTAHVVYPTGNFTGAKWHDIDVTNIVEELIRAHNWDGDGVTGAETGDAIGFIILGAKGSDPRWFQDYRSSVANSADLRIRWNHQPPLIDPPSDDPEFIEQYRNYTIWRELGGLGYPLDPMEYVFTNGTESPYNIKYDDIGGSGPFLVSTSESPEPTRANAQRKLTRLSNGTLYTVYFKKLAEKYQIYVKQSSDNGSTWTNEIRVSVNAAKHMEIYDQYGPAIAVDASDNLHVVWHGPDDDSTPYDWIWYTKYTDSWSAPLRLWTISDWMQRYPSIAVDSSGDIHVVWMGKPGPVAKYQIWHTKYTDSWSIPVRISTLDTMEDHDQTYPSLEIGSNDYLHVAWKGNTDIYYLYDVIWYAKYDGAWQEPLLIFQYGVGNQNDPSSAIDSSGNIHVVWYGNSPYGAAAQILYKKYDGSWSSEHRLSNATGMDEYGQSFPSIAVDSNDIIHVVWDGMMTGLIDEDKVFYTNYTDSWATPVCLQPTGANTRPNLRWSMWPKQTNGTYFITDLNGTVLVIDLDDLDDAYDWIDEEQGYDPKDPEPPAWEDAPVAFSRFRMRLYLLIIGYGCVWGPIWFMCWKRPSGYYIGCAFIVMLMGLGLLLQIPNI